MPGGPGNAHGTVAIGLRWLVAAGAIAAFGVGFTMVDPSFSPARLTRFSITVDRRQRVRSDAHAPDLAPGSRTAPMPMALPRW